MKYILLSVLNLLFLHFAKAQSSYTDYLTGNPQDTVVQPDFGICLMGGAGESDDGMKWFLEKANGGDVVVLRASGSDGYNDYMFSELGVTLNSVETILFNSAEAANDPYVIERLNGAEAIWLAGGDQSDYITYWKDTPIVDAINNLINVRGGAVGGLSAGMAVMAQGYYSAVNGGITSEEALANPFNLSLTLGWNDFIHAPFLENAITETHFNDPDRIRYGRVMAFMARLTYDQNLPYVRGFAANEYCAIAIGTDGLAHAYVNNPNPNNDFVYFLQSNCEVEETPEIIEANQPLTWERSYKAVKVYKVPATTTGENYFDLNDWVSGHGGAWENWYVTEGVLSQSDDELAPNCTIGIAEKQNELFKIFPNPVADKLMIQFSEPFSGKWQVTDISGRLVLAGKAAAKSDETIDVSGLNSGTYNLILISDSRQDSSTFFKTR